MFTVITTHIYIILPFWPSYISLSIAPWTPCILSCISIWSPCTSSSCSIILRHIWSRSLNLHYIIQHMALDTLYSTMVLIPTFPQTSLQLTLDILYCSFLYWSPCVTLCSIWAQTPCTSIWSPPCTSHHIHPVTLSVELIAWSGNWWQIEPDLSTFCWQQKEPV